MTSRDELIKSLRKKHEEERKEAAGKTEQLRPTPSQTECDLARLGHNVVDKIPTNARAVETVLVEMPRDVAEDLERQMIEHEKAEAAKPQVAEPKMMVDEDQIHRPEAHREMEPGQAQRGYETREARSSRKKKLDDEEAKQ